MGDLYHCNRYFGAAESHKLHSHGEFIKIFAHQLLLEGICPNCNLYLMAWQGIDSKGEIYALNPIKPKHYASWLKRKIIFSANKLDPKGVDIVQGSQSEFPYRLVRRAVY